MIEDINLGSCIHVYRNSLSQELCDEIWNFFHDNISFATQGKTISGVSKKKVTLDFLQEEFIHHPDEIKDGFFRINEKIYEALKDPISSYIQTYDWLATCPNIVDTGYLWQRYQTGEGKYDEHIDGCQWIDASANRLMGIVAYVNTVEEGGETHFRYQNVSVKPEAGSVLVFPASWSHPHQSNIPITSEKLIISSFVIDAEFRNRHHH